MPGRARTHHGGEEPDAEGGRPSRVRPESGSVRQAEGSVADTIHAGRPTGLVTTRSGQAGGVPTGTPTRIKPSLDATVQRSLQLENQGAAVLAGHGYAVQQNPTKPEVAQARLDTGDTGNPLSKPDYLLEGRVFDCYSPQPSKDVRGIHWEVKNKVVTKRQTQRMIVNLADWRGDIADLHQQFRDWPIPGLKELKVITPGGDIVQIDLPRGSE